MAPPFNDVPEAMRALKENFRLAVLSNSEPDIIRHSIIRIGTGMDAIVLAADAKCYKPAPGMFRALLAHLETPADQVTHVAQSFYHDIARLRKLVLGDGSGSIAITRRVTPHTHLITSSRTSQA